MNTGNVGLMVLLLGSGMIAGCDTRPVAPVVSAVDAPAEHSETTVHVGETVCVADTSSTQDAIVLDSPISGSFSEGLLTGVRHFKVEVGTLVAKDENDEERFYYADRVDYCWGSLGLPWSSRPGGIKIGKDGTWSIFCSDNGEAVSVTPPPTARRVRVCSSGSSGKRQELVYAGRDGPNVRFTYRQSGGGQPDCSTDLTYSPSLAEPFSVAGARIRVVRVTDDALTCVVLTRFARS